MVEFLSNFPGFAVEYDSAKNPFFKAIVTENLLLIKSKPLGVELLKGIAAATPKSRGGYPIGVNVLIKPYEMNYSQGGYKTTTIHREDGSVIKDGMKASPTPAHNPSPTNLSGPNKGADQCLFHKVGSSLNKAVDTTQTSGGGTVCMLEFSNAQMMISDGSLCWPHIVLAHELIHSLHCLTGVHAGSDEEEKTTGVGAFKGEHMSENSFRAAFGQTQRGAY